MFVLKNDSKKEDILREFRQTKEIKQVYMKARNKNIGKHKLG